MVNLLIAQMGSAYDKLEELGPLIQNYNTVTMCMEYKDLQDSLPPPLNVLLIRTLTRTLSPCHPNPNRNPNPPTLTLALALALTRCFSSPWTSSKAGST